MYSEAVQDDNQGSSTGRWVPGSIMDRMIFCTGSREDMYREERVSTFSRFSMHVSFWQIESTQLLSTKAVQEQAIRSALCS